jgi:hypothetical protein
MEKMKKNKTSKSTLIGMLALSLALPLVMATSHAAGVPSSKVTYDTSDTVLIPATSGTSDWVDVLSAVIKTPNNKDMFITAAFEAGLFTDTTVTGGGTDSAQASGSVEVRILLDGEVVDPGAVVYANRIQTLNTTLDLGESIQLTLDTTAAASFTFVAVDVPVGVHTITAQARVVTSDLGDAEATGAVGKGSLTVESVRLVKTP